MRSEVVPLTGSYNGWLIAVSLVIAASASYVALDLAGRVTEACGRSRLAWLVGGAGAMGLGIWSMHYVGMLAFSLPVPVLYDQPTVALSLLAAVLASGAALFVVSRRTFDTTGAVGGSLVMGIGIAAMHYIGMAAMRMPALCHWNAGLVALSVVVAIGVSFAALWLAFRVKAESRLAPQKLASAAVMGLAVAAMHYIGMAAAGFVPARSMGDIAHAVGVDPLGIAGIVTITFMVFSVAIVTSIVNRRFSAQSVALQLSEERYRQVFERSLAGLYRSAPDGRLLECNQAFARIFGYASCEEMLARPTTDLYSDPEARATFVGELQADGASIDRESYLRRRDGSAVWVLENATLLAGRDGLPGVIEGTLLDISERKQAERVLRESEARKAAILDASQQAIVTFDRQGQIVEFNAVAERLHGRRREEVIGHPLAGLLMPDSMRSEFESGLADLLSDHGRSFLQPFEAVGLRSDGSEFPTEVSVARVQMEGPPLFTSSVRDLSEQRLAEMALRESEARAEKIIDNMLGGVIMADEGYVIRSVNRAAARMFGFRQDQLIGQHLNSILPEFGEGPDKLHLRDLEPQVTGRVSEWIGRRKDGTEFRFELSVCTFHYGGRRYVAGNLRDLTELRAVERVKQELISTVNHELRTPLTSIRGSLTLLSSGALGELPSEAKEIVAVAERNCLRLLALINDILDFERLERGELEMEREPVSVATLMERSREVMSGVAQAQAIAIELKPIPAVLIGDLDRLVQVLINLLSNAVKFSPRGSTVVVSAAASQDTVEVRVTDRGRGISATHCEVIFERFKQVESSDARQKGGSGLGLAISKSIIRQLGGEIGVKSEEGVGSTFWFHLPAAGFDGARERPVVPAAPTPTAALRD